MDSTIVESSFKYCEEIAKKHYENFPVASRLIPEDRRKYIYAIYAFARQADDFADEDNVGTDEERLRLIDDWNEKLRKSPENPVFVALSETIKVCSLPLEPFEKLLKAFRQDVIKKRYDTFDEVLSYCENSANPVGRLVLMVLDEINESLFKYSDYICTALQLTNFWQDAAIDLKKGRMYIPAEDVNRFNEDFRNIIKYEVERTEEFFQRGKPLISLVKFKRELKLIWLGGMEILNKIRQNDYDVFNKRPVLNNLDKIKLFAKANFV